MHANKSSRNDELAIRRSLDRKNHVCKTVHAISNDASFFDLEINKCVFLFCGENIFGLELLERREGATDDPRA